MDVVSAALINFLKGRVLSHNEIALYLFKIKLTRYLDAIMNENTDHIPEIIIDAIISHANYNDTFRAFKLIGGDKLFYAILRRIPFELCLPNDNWHPQNFMIAAKDKEIDEKTLNELGKKNEMETDWFKNVLIPALDERSTFILSQPMIFFEENANIPFFQDDISNLLENDLTKNKVINIIRFILPVINHVDALTIVNLIQLRTRRNIQVRICLILTEKTLDTDITCEYVEWLSAKLEIPLIKFDLRAFNKAIPIDILLTDNLNERFNDEILWSYGLQAVHPLNFCNICSILPKKSSKEIEFFEFLNNHNIPIIR